MAETKSSTVMSIRAYINPEFIYKYTDLCLFLFIAFQYNIVKSKIYCGAKEACCKICCKCN